MVRTLHLVAVGFLVVVGNPATTNALAGHGTCNRCGSACNAGQLVECTVRVPATVMETRMKSRVVKKVEQREETYTVFKRVPETRKFTKEKCYLEDDVRTKTITEKKCHRVQNPVVKTYEVNVLEPETHEFTVQKEICTKCGKVCIEQPCTCTVMRKQPDVRSDTYEVPDVVFETAKREINYCVKVPKKQTVTCSEETTYKLVPVEKTRTVEVCVPEIVKEPIEMPVRKMVTKKIWCCQACSQKHDH